ncbi:MAG: histidine kinase, partial [Bacteroidota bacterium]
MKVCAKKQILGFDDTWLIVFGIPIVAMIMPLLASPDLSEFNLTWYKTHFLISLFQVPFYWFIFRKVFMVARAKYPNFSITWKRMTFQLVCVIVIYLILEPILGKVCRIAFIGDNHEMGGVTLTVATMVMIALWIAIYEGIYFYQQLKLSIQEKEELQRENIKSQLEGLKSKVNPHFLFNSLNTLSYLIPEDADKSVKFVQKLSKVYRYILEMSDEKLIPLQKELDFLNAYIFLLKERFEENLQVEMDIPTVRLNDKIIPLSLQILF